MWIGIESQPELDALNESLCWEDSRILEYYATSALRSGLPEDVSRSGYERLNLYVLIDTCGVGGAPFLELALLAYDRIGADVFERMHLSGKVDALKRVEIISGDGSTLLRCARVAYRRLNEADFSGHYFLGKGESEW